MTPPAEAPAPSRRVSVLVHADPDLARTLEELGLDLRVTFAESGPALLVELAAQSFDVSLVCSDGAIAPLLREARARHSTARLIVVAEPKDRSAVQLLLEGVVDGLLERPVHRDELLYSLASVGAGPVHPSAANEKPMALLFPPGTYDDPPLSSLVEQAGLGAMGATAPEAALEILDRVTSLPLCVLDLETRPVESVLFALQLYARSRCDVLGVLPRAAAALATTRGLARGVDFVVRPVRGDDVARRIRRLHERWLERAERDTSPGIWIASRNPLMRRTLGLIESIAPTETTVCMRGEPGAGKETLARLVHDWSPRSGAPIHVVNCAAMHESQLDAEIFGHDRDPATGVVRLRRGLIELVGHGTLFLDEVDALSVGMQAKILRLLEDREFVRIGGVELLRSHARIIASTSQSLEGLVQQGRFDRNLYRWIMQVPLPVPPLRERIEDVPELATFVLRRLARAHGRPAVRIAPTVVPQLLRHDWPGNIAELEQVLELSLLKGAATELRELELSAHARAFRADADPEATRVDLPPTDALTVAVQLITARGNAKLAAAIAGLDRRSFYERILSQQSDPLGLQLPFGG